MACARHKQHGGSAESRRARHSREPLARLCEASAQAGRFTARVCRRRAGRNPPRRSRTGARAPRSWLSKPPLVLQHGVEECIAPFAALQLVAHKVSLAAHTELLHDAPRPNVTRITRCTDAMHLHYAK